MPEEILSAAARRRLIELARRAIETELAAVVEKAVQAEDVESPREELQRRAGAFVTLVRRSNGELRGCVGLTEARYPLHQVVARMAVAAALHDGRFTPVGAHELADLSVHVSVLGPLTPIEPDEVEVGVHGVVVRCAGKMGLLLPQVAVEHQWTREQFLDATCRKAGLSEDTWRQPWCEVLVFTAAVFGED